MILPKYRGDLVQCAVVAERMVDGGIEATTYPRNPLDVLAQQIVAMCAMEPWTGRRPRRGRTPQRAVRRRCRSRRSRRCSTCCPGRYPSDDFAELRPRITWDRVTGVLAGRPGAQRLAVTSGGTIPDRGMFGVFLVGEKGIPRRRARRGDGLRVARRRRLPARLERLADRGHHPRPRARHARARAARADAVLARRRPRPAGRAGPRARRVPARAVRARPPRTPAPG